MSFIESYSRGGGLSTKYTILYQYVARLGNPLCGSRSKARSTPYRNVNLLTIAERDILVTATTIPVRQQVYPSASGALTDDYRPLAGTYGLSVTLQVLGNRLENLHSFLCE
jgi:hypothetical protein